MENTENKTISFAEDAFGAWKILEIAGRIDTVTAGAAEEKAKEELNGGEKLALDLSKLEYISSAGLRVLLRLAKKAEAAEKDFALVGVNGLVKEVLEESGLDVLFTAVESQSGLSG